MSKPNRGQVIHLAFNGHESLEARVSKSAVTPSGFVLVGHKVVSMRGPDGKAINFFWAVSEFTSGAMVCGGKFREPCKQVMARAVERIEANADYARSRLNYLPKLNQ